MLVDVVLYAGERHLLDARIALLKADITLVIQGTHSFTNQEKPIYDLPKNVIGVNVESHKYENPWDNEKALRHEGSLRLNDLDLPDDAIVGYFDVDEIPDAALIRKTSHLIAWDMPKYQMSLAWFQPLMDREGLSGVSALWGQVKNENAQTLRSNRALHATVKSGWHLSSFMTLEELKTKWRNFSHQELVKDDMDAWIENCWINGLAVENGKPLTEQPMTDLPAEFYKLPDYMKRTRPQSRG